MKRITIIVLLLVSASGCVILSWEHPTRTEQDFERDKYECVRETHTAGLGAPPLFEQCMKLRGYTEHKR
jgi:hypothetical protein